MQARLDASRRAYDRMLAAFKEGVLSDADAEEMLPRLREACASREHEWTMISVAPPVIALHPTLIAEYLRHVDALRASLSIYGRQGDEPTARRGVPRGRSERHDPSGRAAPMLRGEREGSAVRADR